MKRIKKYFKRGKYLCLSLLLTLILITIIFVCKDIFPFGNNVFNDYDFDYGYVPVYFKLWDILHGMGSTLFDWNLGTGLNCFGSLISNSLWMPSSLIVALFSRNFIPYGMSYVLILKLLTITGCTFVAVHKLFPKLNGMYKVIFVNLYTFCGWTYFMMANLLYLDVVALFPLFVLAYYRLMKDNKWLMYLVVLTLCLLLNYYMSYMILFFIIGVTFIALLTLDIKDKMKKAVKVLLLTLLSLGLSCILFLPSFYQSMTSYRMTGLNMGDDVGYLASTLLKVIYMFPMVPAILLTGKQLMVKKDKKINLFFILILIYFLIGIFIEPINKMWHTGSYSGLPFRYSYIPSFMFILISLYYLKNNYENKIKKINIINIIATVMLFGLLIVFAYIFKDEVMKYSYIHHLYTYGQFFALLFLFIIGIGMVLIIFKNTERVKKILLILFLIINSSIYGYYFVQKDDLKSSSLVSVEFHNKFDLIEDGYNYVDNTLSLNDNFPYILRVPSIQNRLHIIKENEIIFNEMFGYYGYDTFIYSAGGNLFSDLLLQNKYYFSGGEMNSKLFNLLEKNGDYYLYESKYNLNYIIPYSGKNVDLDSGSIIDNTNNAYKLLFNKEEDLIHKEELKEKMKLKKDRIYYVYSANNEIYDLFYEIRDVDYKLTNFLYPSYDIFGFSINVEENIKLELENKYEDIEIGYIDVNEYIKFVESINDYEVTYRLNGNDKVFNYKALEDTSLLIPVNYDESLIVRVNNKKVDYKLNVYNMLSIDVKKGNNKIEVSYVPKFHKEGIIISLVSFIILVIVYYTDKKFKYLDKKYILYPLFGITSIIGIGFILKIYLLFWL